jgi:hypothetical protein
MPTSRTQFRIKDLSLQPSQQLFGIAVVAGTTELTWRILRPPATLEGEVVGDGISSQHLDLTTRSVSLPDPGQPGFHEITLQPDESEITLSGANSLTYLVPAPSGNLVMTVEGDNAGSVSYAVPRGTSFRVRWDTYPAGSDVGALRLHVTSGQGVVTRQLPSGSRAFDFIGGIEDPIDVRIESADPPLHAEIRVEVLEHTPSETMAPTIGAAVLGLARSGQAEMRREPGTVEVEKSIGKVEVRLVDQQDELLTTPLTYRIADFGLLDEFERLFEQDEGAPWPRVVSRLREGRRAAWVAAPITKVDRDEALSHVDADLVEDLIARRTALLPSLLASGGIGETRLAQHESEIVQYLGSYSNLLESLAATEQEISP